MDVFTSDEANLFSEVYGKTLFSRKKSLFSSLIETVLTKKAYNNSCLLITFYTRPDIDEVNTLNSPERERLLDEFRCNNKFNEILNYFENRIFFLDIRQEENLDEYIYGSTKYNQYQIVNDMIYERKQIVYKHLSQFIEYFFPGKRENKNFELRFSLCFKERFDCENMKTMRDIILKNDELEGELNELKEIVSDVANERSTTRFYDLLRFMPITNMFINVFGRVLEKKKLIFSSDLSVFRNDST